MLQFGHLSGAAANTSSHGSESSSRCSAQKEKQSVNIEELSDSSEEEPKRRQRINWISTSTSFDPSTNPPALRLQVNAYTLCNQAAMLFAMLFDNTDWLKLFV